MSKSDNPSHKEKKDPSAIKKQSENEREEEAGPSNTDQLAAGVDKLNIKESTPSSDRDQIRVKFLINVPVGVTPEMSDRPESHCQTFLDLLWRTAFKPEDKSCYKDIAVVFGLNGKESVRGATGATEGATADSEGETDTESDTDAEGDTDTESDTDTDSDADTDGAIDTEFEKPINSKIVFEKFKFSWQKLKVRKGIKNGSKVKTIPYRTIRETIKEHEHTRNLVKQFRTESPECKIYFCFFDADTVDFNHVLSSYIDVIHEHKYPTVMSTGYVFPKNSENRENSERDRQVRIKTAEHFPLGTYYPEANFCVLLPDGIDTLPEKFDYPRDSNNDMESPNLITQVKTRKGFIAVFADKDPIVTPNLTSTKKQFHTDPWTWATGARAHKELELTRQQEKEVKKYKKMLIKNKFKDDRMVNGEYTRLLMNLVKDLRKEHRKQFQGPGTDQVFEAARAVRKLLEQQNERQIEDPPAV